jgi:hypothetical protein
MRRAVRALALSLALSTSAFAQKDSPLELVRSLRANGQFDLAAQKLEELRAKPTGLSPDEVQILPLELARIRLEEASRETEDSRRATLIGQARAAFEEFTRNNPDHPMAAQANVEIARLLALQAKGRLSRANRLESADAKAREYTKIRPEFTKAMARYQEAIANLDGRIQKLDEATAAKKDKESPLAAELKRSKAQAELDAVVLQYELGQTFVGDDDRKKRGEEMDKAIKAFEKLGGQYQDTRIGFLARVWAFQSRYSQGEEKAAGDMNRYVSANRTHREAGDAVRLAAYFAIQHTFEADRGKEGPEQKFLRTEQAADDWLSKYPDAKNTPEGLGARYRRALMKEQRGLLPPNARFEESKPKKDEPAGPRKIVNLTAAGKGLLEEANKHYKELAETENEYSDRAQRRRLTNQLLMLEAEGKGGDTPLRSINTLEQGYLAAQIQLARIYDLEKSNQPADKREAEEKRRTQLATQYLERGLRLATAKDTPRDVFDAQMLLIRFLTQNERAVEAAVLGEALARNNPKVPKAALAAQLAVYAYNTALARLKSSGGSDEAAEADVARIKRLALFADATWPNDGPTDAIRHILAFYQGNRDKDYDAAWKTYSRIGTGYPDLYQARREMAGALFYLVRPEEKDPKKYREALQKNITDRAQQWRTTMSALESLPEPQANAPAHEAESWAGAKTMQAQLYYLAGDADRVQATVKQVVDGLKRQTGLDDKKRDDLAYTARVLHYNALQSRAADYIRGKEYAKVGEVLGKELEALKADLGQAAPADAPPGFERMRQAQRGLLIAAMSASVQNKQADEASKLLDILQGAGGSLEANLAVLQQLVTAIRGQIDTLTKAGNKAEADDLARNFTEFLDKIRGDDTSKLAPGVVVFLGQGYGAVDQPARAAELFEQLINKPFVNTAKTDEEQRDAATKHETQVRQWRFYQAQALRQAGGKPNFDKAMALMQEVVGDPVKKGAKLGWGYRNLTIRKEYCRLLEDQGLFGAAGQNWVKLASEFGGADRGGPPAPVKFLGLRPTILAYAQAMDEAALAAFGVPAASSAGFDQGFKNVYPALAERRNAQRQIYFDIFVEVQRCSARSYSAPQVVAKIKGGPDAANLKLADVGQKLHELLARNEDVSPEIREKIHDVLNQYPLARKKFDELAAAGPKS